MSGGGHVCDGASLSAVPWPDWKHIWLLRVPRDNVDTVDIVDTVDTVDNVDTVGNVDIVDNVDTVDCRYRIM